MKAKLQFFAQFFLVVAVIAYLMFSAYWVGNALTAHRLESQRTYQEHVWSEWSEPVIVSDWWNGTAITQHRKCSHCDKVEVKETRP